MTDNEIIKALECDTHENCEECPHYHEFCECIEVSAKDILDLINRQKAEIEALRKVILDADYSSYSALKAKQDWHIQNSEYINKLNEENEKLTTMYYSMQSTLTKMSMGVEEAKAEAIKEFAERLKKTFHIEEIWNGEDEYWYETIDYEDIDNLVKEMVGEG